MSRIKQLIDVDNQDDDDWPKGPGDPDSYGYPGEHDILCDGDCCKTDITKYINKLTRKDKRNGRRKATGKTSR